MGTTAHGPSSSRGGIPDDILYDEKINAAIAAVLPSAYNFEVQKSIAFIRSQHATSVALQLPEGLTLWATALADLLSTFTGAEMTIMGDVTYGACCVDDYTALALGCDALIHYGHSCLVPVDQTRIRTLYVFVEIALDATHLAHTVRANFPPSRSLFRQKVLSSDLDARNARPILEIATEAEAEAHAPNDKQTTHLALVGTVQFVTAVQDLYDALAAPLDVSFPEALPERLQITAATDDATASSGAAAPSQRPATINIAGRSIATGSYQVTIPQIKPLSPGEVLGCTSPRLDANQIDAILYIGDGRFHLESIMIANPRIPAFRYDPYTKRFMRELYDHAQMRDTRSQAVRTAQQSLPSANVPSPTLSLPSLSPIEDTTEVKPTEKNIPSAWGVILGTLGRQGSLTVLEHIRHLLSTYTPDKQSITAATENSPRSAATPSIVPSVPILLSELSPAKLSLFGPHLSAFVQTSCPRLSIDWGYAFPRPLLTPYEAAVALGATSGWDAGSRVKGLGMKRKPLLAAHAHSPSSSRPDQDIEIELGDYPMDFYANDSRGPWTPRHGMSVARRNRPTGGKGNNLAILKRAKARMAAAAAEAGSKGQ